jgi:hypothetical protein
MSGNHGCVGFHQEWLRGLDSNQNNQLQRLMSYQLDDPGVVIATTFTSCSSFCLWVKRVNYSNFGSKLRNEIRYSRDCLRTMSDAELIQFGRSLRNLCRVKRVSATPDNFEVQLKEAREEWRRRYPKV